MHNNHFDPTKPVVVHPGIAGPRSEIGKQTSSRNAMRHGCCSTETLILKTENLEDYKALEATWFKAYSPKDDAEKHLVQELVNADWFLQRSSRNVARVEAQISEAVEIPLFWADDHHRALTRFMRYQTARANTVAKCRKAIEDYRKNRTAEAVRAEQLVIKKERHEVFKEKSKPEPTIQELLDQMMAQKAERDRLKQQAQPEL
jgi:hypothetical protein